MNVYRASFALLFCFTAVTVHCSDPNYLAGHDVFINCGSEQNPASINDRKWLGDRDPGLSSVLQIKGSSTTSRAIHKKPVSSDELLYTTARISQSRFSYSFDVNPGQKMIRFHFSPTLYKGFKGFRDIFSVAAGSFTFLSNFSSSLMAKALRVNYFVKEFCLYLHEDEQLNITFTSASSSSSSSLQNTYAFINGIEIISVPSEFAYFHGEDIGVQLVGQKSNVYIDYSTALERIYKLVIKQSSDRDFDGIFPVHMARKRNVVKNSTWKVPVDVGFRYLIRLHLSELGHRITESSNAMYSMFINNMVADTNIGMAKEMSEKSIPWYSDYMVMMRGQKDVKHEIVISVQSNVELTDGLGLIAAIEVLKLSNSENSLAIPNHQSETPDTSHRNIQTLLQILGYRNTVSTIGVIILALVSVVVHILRESSDVNSGKEETRPSVRAQQLCRHFSLAELKVATENFREASLLGKGGFGKVYRGVIDNGQTIVAVKRLKPGSSQGAREFLMEIETLSELRHFNLVSLIGYCRARGEMILVYDYMTCGTLADHLYKLPRDSSNFFYLTWKQRLNICIGAARGLDYLHNGHGLIHRDVKASNILLDENLVAKVSDFGLAKHEDRRKLESHISTNVKGTRGYLDPHYAITHKLTRKSDTYAFGVVLLETLCGRPVLDYTCEDDSFNLIKWARDIISKGNINQIVAPDIRDEISKRSLEAFIAVVENCLGEEPKKRPTMGQVVLQLESVLELQDGHQVFGLNVIACNSGANMGQQPFELNETVISSGADMGQRSLELNETVSGSGADTGQQYFELNETENSSSSNMGQQYLELNETARKSVVKMGRMSKATAELIKQFYIPQHIFYPQLKPESLPFVPECPVMVFIYSKNGGQLGRDLLATYRSLLHDKQVVNLGEEAPDKILHRLFLNLERLKSENDKCAAEVQTKLKLIVAGGDGTGGWLLGVVSDLKLSQPPPIAFMPLGTSLTENNLPYAFGWGDSVALETGQRSVLSFLDRVKKAKVMKMDSWHILLRMRAPQEDPLEPIAPLQLPHSLHAFHRISGPHNLKVESYNTFRGGFWSYFSMGADAQVSYEFDLEQKLHPKKFNNQTVNPVNAAIKGFLHGWSQQTCYDMPANRNIARLCKVRVMKSHGYWLDLHIPSSVRSIICLNVPSYLDGKDIWRSAIRNKHRDRGLSPSFVDDGLLEIIGFSSTWQTSYPSNKVCLAQAHGIRFEFHKRETDHTYMMIDGEAWKQPLPCDDDDTVVVEISRLGQVKVLVRDGCRSKSVYESPNWSAQENNIDKSDSNEDESVGKEWRKFGAAKTFKYSNNRHPSS